MFRNPGVTSLPIVQGPVACLLRFAAQMCDLTLYMVG